MDDIWPIFAILGIILLGASPVLLVVGIIHCVALHRTRTWAKAKAAGFPQPLSQLEPSNVDLENGDSDEDFDSEDEREEEAKRREEEEDRNLTFRQKYKKELKKCYSNSSIKEKEKKKERQDRKMLAKAVAKELARREAREQRRAQQAGPSSAADSVDGLPSYTNVTTEDRKV